MYRPISAEMFKGPEEGLLGLIKGDVAASLQDQQIVVQRPLVMGHEPDQFVVSLAGGICAGLTDGRVMHCETLLSTGTIVRLQVHNNTEAETSPLETGTWDISARAPEAQNEGEAVWTLGKTASSLQIPSH